MKLFQRMFFAAVLAGLASGIVYAALQQWKVAPIILEAEVYENAAPAEGTSAGGPTQEAAAAGHEHQVAGPAHTHDEEAWAPQDGPERMFYTVLADLLAAIGFAMLIGAVSVLSGLPVTAGNGVIWGLSGFLVFQLAPALGLAPELPGMPAADVFSRQVWWWSTAFATGTAILGVAKFRNWTAIGVGAVLILLPHLVGAPAVPEAQSAVPAHLATEFAANALFSSAAFWLMVGPLLGWLIERFSRAAATPTASEVAA